MIHRHVSCLGNSTHMGRVAMLAGDAPARLQQVSEQELDIAPKRRWFQVSGSRVGQVSPDFQGTHLSAGGAGWQESSRPEVIWRSTRRTCSPSSSLAATRASQNLLSMQYKQEEMLPTTTPESGSSMCDVGQAVRCVQLLQFVPPVGCAGSWRVSEGRGDAALFLQGAHIKLGCGAAARGSAIEACPQSWLWLFPNRPYLFRPKSCLSDPSLGPKAV